MKMMKCAEIEINVISPSQKQDDYTVKIPVEAGCLEDDCGVELPMRYALQTRGAESLRCKPDEDIKAREEDLSIALKWIRQEILLMKKQDKNLVHTFKQLRATILKLRPLAEQRGLSLTDSSWSLDDRQSASLRRTCQNRRHDGLTDFWDRTPTFMTPPARPKKKSVLRFKWRSDEFV